MLVSKDPSTLQLLEVGAGISGLLIFYSDRVNGALMWMVGGLAARSWPHAVSYTHLDVYKRQS